MKDLTALEKFFYSLSALGFNYQTKDNSWCHPNGAVCSDEAMRDIICTHPAMAGGILDLFKRGAQQIEISHDWEGDQLVTRLRGIDVIERLGKIGDEA